MSTFLTQGNDIYLTESNSLAFAEDGAEATANIIQNELRTQKGELQLDVERGIPYLETVLGDNPDVSVWEGYMIQAAENVDNVIRVDSMESKSSNNILSYEMKIKTTYGDVMIEG
jgi:hypothetical protein